MTKLAGKLPKGDRLGLGSLARQLLANPEAEHVAVILFDTSKITTDIDTGLREETIRILRFEGVEDADQAAALQAWMHEQYRLRTDDGQQSEISDLPGGREPVRPPGDILRDGSGLFARPRLVE